MVFKKAKKDQEESTEERNQQLRPHEQFWSRHYDFLKEHGYQLRPRYQPNRKLKAKEELISLAQRNVMDAIQISDKRKVCLKLMKPDENSNTRELAIDSDSDVESRVVSAIDFIPIPGTDDQIAILPYLRIFDDPQFETLGQVFEAVDQFLEGLEYIHQHDMAHRDACWRNMMMDASELIPKGWHFARQWSEDGTKPIRLRPRSKVSVKYYFIDFELSVYADSLSPNPLATGIVGQDRTVPEFQSQDQEAQYNPFKLDIYQLGNAFKTRLLENYDGLDCLNKLIQAMTSETPSERPSAKEAREMLSNIVKDAEPKSPITLKPGVRIWGSNPPRIGNDSIFNQIFDSIDSIKDWFLSRIPSIRKRA